MNVVSKKPQTLASLNLPKHIEKKMRGWALDLIREIKSEEVYLPPECGNSRCFTVPFEKVCNRMAKFFNLEEEELRTFKAKIMCLEHNWVILEAEPITFKTTSGFRTKKIFCNKCLKIMVFDCNKLRWMEVG